MSGNLLLRRREDVEADRDAGHGDLQWAMTRRTTHRNDSAPQAHGLDHSHAPQSCLQTLSRFGLLLAGRRSNAEVSEGAESDPNVASPLLHLDGPRPEPNSPHRSYRLRIWSEVVDVAQDLPEPVHLRARIANSRLVAVVNGWRGFESA
ncbi:MAG: hypothetical protein WA890_06070 [Micromonospora sp.]